MIHVISKEQCCGCSACVQKCPKSCISLHEDEEGFLYPQVDENSCINCGLCEKVCPILSQGEKRIPLKVYAAKNKNEEIRIQSSSGGIFTLLAEEILRENGVVFGARFDENWEVIHDYTETIEGLAAFRGSKYMQSRIGETYKQVEGFLKAGRKVLFSGTPCQVRGLKLFLCKEFDNLLTVDFICHGVPSPKVWRMYLLELIARKGVVGKNTVFSSLNDIPVISEISFRDKSAGWKKFSFRLALSEQICDGKKNSVFVSHIFQEDAYMRAFLSNINLRPGCYKCPSRSGKSDSDVTIADYWAIGQVKPDFDDDKGIGLVLIHTEKGQKYYPLEKTFSIETGYMEAQGRNGGFLEITPPHPKRKYFFKAIEKKTSVINIVDSCLHVSFIQKIYRKIKRKVQRIMSCINR